MEKRNTTQAFRQAVKERCGDKCYICGESPVEYHHLIPLWRGGEDRVENFIALCPWHHMVLHGATSMDWNRKSGGRHRSVAIVDGYKYILDDYLRCRIGTTECKDALGMQKGTALADRVWFKEYLTERGIVAYRNNIDIIKRRVERGDRRRKKAVGWAEFEDGHRETYYWEDMKVYDA